MKISKIVMTTALGYLLFAQQAFASEIIQPPRDIPEIDGGAAIVAIGLVAGLVALIREKFFRD